MLQTCCPLSVSHKRHNIYSSVAKSASRSLQGLRPLCTSTTGSCHTGLFTRHLYQIGHTQRGVYYLYIQLLNINLRGCRIHSQSPNMYNIAYYGWWFVHHTFGGTSESHQQLCNLKSEIDINSHSVLGYINCFKTVFLQLF